MWNDFKKFAFRGNVIDMAVGVIIGGAFSKIVTALVNNIIMPLLSIVIGKINFSDLKWVISPEKTVGGVTVPENAMHYGDFIQSVIDFFIIAFCIFIFVKIITKAHEKLEKKIDAAEDDTPKKPTTDELLTEIRDLLKEEKSK